MLTTPTNLRKTSLYHHHIDQQAKMIPFGEWLLPLSYESVLQEHHHVRSHVGIFDVSHMGEIFVRGLDAKNFLQTMTINDLEQLKVGNSQYSAILTPKGGIIDDLLIYNTSKHEYLLCVNAANTTKDFLWLSEHSNKYQNLGVTNESEQWAQIAIQGPNSLAVLEQALQEHHKEIQSLTYGGILTLLYQNKTCYLSRTGYTGEKGYELYIPNKLASSIWELLLQTNPLTKVKPIGLGARDTLRLEVCYLLYGQDMNEEISPLEAGIAWATKLNKPMDFIGKEALIFQKENGLKRKLFAFQMIDTAIPRQGMDIYKNEKKIGVVTSGSVLPSLGSKGGMALLQKHNVELSDCISIDIRGKRKKAKIVNRPMYQPKIKD